MEVFFVAGGVHTCFCFFLDCERGRPVSLCVAEIRIVSSTPFAPADIGTVHCVALAAPGEGLHDGDYAFGQIRSVMVQTSEDLFE